MELKGRRAMKRGLVPGLSGPYRAMRAAMRCEWRRVLNTEMAMRCDAKILAMRVLAAEILCDAPPRCKNTSDAMPRCWPLSSCHRALGSPYGAIGLPYTPSVTLTGPFLIDDQSAGFNCIGPRGAFKSMGIGRTQVRLLKSTAVHLAMRLQKHALGRLRTTPRMLTTLGCSETPDPKISSVDKYLEPPEKAKIAGKKKEHNLKLLLGLETFRWDGGLPREGTQGPGHPTECFLSAFGHLARSAPKSVF